MVIVSMKSCGELESSLFALSSSEASGGSATVTVAMSTEPSGASSTSFRGSSTRVDPDRTVTVSVVG